MPQVRTSRYYSRLPDLDVSKSAGEGITGLTGNTDLSDPPVKPADLTTLKKTSDDGIVAAAGGATLLTAERCRPRAALVTSLNKDASYVDINCDEDLTILLSSRVISLFSLALNAQHSTLSGICHSTFNSQLS